MVKVGIKTLSTKLGDSAKVRAQSYTLLLPSRESG